MQQKTNLDWQALTAASLWVSVLRQPGVHIRVTAKMLAIALLALISISPARAAIVTNTYQVTASGFSALHGKTDAPPVDPVQLAFTISFDNSAPITDSTSNITLVALNMPNEDPLIYSYLGGDNLQVGDSASAGLIVTGHANFELIIQNISTTPTFGELFYTVKNPAKVAGDVFGTGTGTVIVGPPWAHLAFPMVGVTRTQTVRLNVVEGPVPGPGPCLAQLNIYDAADNLVASRSVSPPGSVSFDYDPLAAFVAGVASGQPGERKELRPEAIFMPASRASGPCQGQATAEVYDGEVAKSTSVITPGLIPPGPIQLPAVQFGPVGVGFLQTVRLNVVAFPPNPCSGILSITDLSGNPLVAPSQVNLTAGHATYIDLPGANILPKLGLHGEVLASFVPTPGAVPGMCIPSVEVYDQLTGRTRAILQNPGPAQVPTGPAN